MSPGDVLYMPKGAIHYALTDASAVSYHLTLGLDRRGQQWLDIISFLLLEQGAGGAAPDQCPQAKAQPRASSSQPLSQPSSPQSSPLSAPSSPSHSPRVHGRLPSELASARLVLALMRIYSETRAGVHLREAVPAWLLVCWRPWNRGATAQPGGGASCAELHAALLEAYERHVARFEAWMGRMAGAGAAEVALERAERERSEAQRPAEAARRRRDGGGARPRPRARQEPRPAQQSEYWWGGDLRAVERLRDAEPLARAFQWMGSERGVAGGGEDATRRDGPPLPSPPPLPAMPSIGRGRCAALLRGFATALEAEYVERKGAAVGVFLEREDDGRECAGFLRWAEAVEERVRRTRWPGGLIRELVRKPAGLPSAPARGSIPGHALASTER